MSNPLPLLPPHGVGNPHVGAGPPNAGTIGDVVLSQVHTHPGDVSIALGSQMLKQGCPELGCGPQLVEGQGINGGL